MRTPTPTPTPAHIHTHAHARARRHAHAGAHIQWTGSPLGEMAVPLSPPGPLPAQKVTLYRTSGSGSGSPISAAPPRICSGLHAAAVGQYSWASQRRRASTKAAPAQKSCGSHTKGAAAAAMRRCPATHLGQVLVHKESVALPVLHVRLLHIIQGHALSGGEARGGSAHTHPHTHI